MKTIQYLSPTSIGVYHKDKTEFYLNYLSDNRPDKIPQTLPMSVGSAFDAYAKSYLHEKLFGVGHDPKFELTALFEAQVEPQNRDFAIKAGKYSFDQYKFSGALSDLMIELSTSIGKPKFEFEVRGVIDGHREGVTKDVGGMTFLGKPDVFFVNSLGAHVILDWKVNGYCSNSAVSPMQGYVRIRDGKYVKGAHKNAHLMNHKGMTINVAGHLEDWNEDWARQLSIYAWLCGEEIGSDFIAAIDQLACKPGVLTPEPSIRVAEHRTRIKTDFQWRVFAQAQDVWEVSHSNHFFRDMTLEQSQERCAALDGVAGGVSGESYEDKWFKSVTRG